MIWSPKLAAGGGEAGRWEQGLGRDRRSFEASCRWGHSVSRPFGSVVLFYVLASEPGALASSSQGDPPGARQIRVVRGGGAGCCRCRPKSSGGNAAAREAEDDDDRVGRQRESLRHHRRTFAAGCAFLSPCRVAGRQAGSRTSRLGLSVNSAPPVAKKQRGRRRAEEGRGARGALRLGLGTNGSLPRPSSSSSPPLLLAQT